ncbi:MAG: redox-regulated ATPase YchF [Thermodesulfovibrionales bacterium]
MLQAGIVGLPNVGKSTLFNVLTKAGAQAANYPFCTIEPNVGVVPVPDPRMDVLATLSKTLKIIPTSVEFVDIAGLVKGASKGEGLGNQFLAHIREVNAIVQVVRCFEDENITHVEQTVDPLRDIEIINIELILADLASAEKRKDRLARNARTAKKEELEELKALEKIVPALEEGHPIRSVDLTDEERETIRTSFYLTSKPILYVCNVAEDDLQEPDKNPFVQKVKEYALKEGAEVVVISAKLEEELIALGPEEAETYLHELGVKEKGLDQLIHATYALLNLITYFTAGEKEVHAWTIVKGTKAPRAAAEIHTDFEKGFIRAEVVGYDDLITSGSKSAAKEKGLVRLEGKEYVVQDGDVMEFRFNV